MPDPTPAKPNRLRLVLALCGVALLVVAALAFANRRTLAREALTGWLKSKRVPAQAQVEVFGPTTFRARLILGDPAHPDFTAERADVRYHLTLGGLQVDRVVLQGPVLRASARGGKLSAGSLDPLIQDFLARPPKPNAAKPTIRVERGQLLLATDYGPLRVTADALVDDGKLQWLTATSAPARLRGAAFDADLGPGRLTEITKAEKMAATLDVPVTKLAASGATLSGGRVVLRFASAYPDPAKTRGLGAFTLAANASATSAEAGGRSLREPVLAAAFVGEAKGWISDLAVAGRATADLRAAGASADGMSAGALRAVAAADDLRWTHDRFDRLSATLVANATGANVSAGALRMDTAVVAVKGPVNLSSSSAKLELTGSASGHGRWSGLGPVGPLDQGQQITIKRAARGFGIAAPAFGLSYYKRPSDVNDAMQTSFFMWPDKPVALRPDTGGEVRFDGDMRAYHLTSAGGGLPVLNLTIRSPSFTNGFAADVSGKARVSASYAVDADIDAAGRLTVLNGRTAFAAQRCATVRIARLEFGVNDVEAVAGRLCPLGKPMFSLAGGDWRLSGRAEGAAASIPFLQMKVADGAGRLTAASRRGRISVQADVTAARVEDTAPQPRFYAMSGSGRAKLDGDVWTADIALRPPRGPKVLDAHLVHDAGLGVGFVTLETGDLAFAEGGLQPAALSPMARAVGGPATGHAQFSGRFDWARIGAGSSGALVLKDLGFQSPAGRVEGLNGTIAFTSLAPLAAAPGQTLNVARVAAIVPLTDLQARFSLADNLLKIEGGEAAVGGGHILVESLEMPLVPGAPIRGVLVFEGVQLHDLVEATPFADKVELDARVSGRVTFESQDGKVRIEGGELKAVEPGRLSIDRTALTGVTASTATPPSPAVPDPNATFTDFAYQAMENLAFDQLTLTVATRSDGRLGALFHIVGRHDPPTKQKIKLGLMDLIRKRFLGRTLPLPSGTKVDLTLDTSLNLDDLLADYANFRRLHGSGQVQP